MTVLSGCLRFVHTKREIPLLRQGTLVDATLVAAPPSTKNRDQARDPEMHQTKKDNNYYFGLKAHIGVDAESGLTHTVVTTAANAQDVTQAHALLHGEEADVFGDAGYQGVDKREENKDRAVNWHVAMRPGKRRMLPDTPLGQLLEQTERAKASVRSKVDGTPVPHRQTAVWLPQDPLSWHRQEHRPDRHPELVLVFETGR